MEKSDKVAEIATKKQKRIIEAVSQVDNENDPSITFSHSTMCQTSLPFKNMGDERKWVSKNGLSVIMLEAGSVLDPERDDFIQLGLPYGTKPRLILLYLNRQAILTGSPEIEVENSLSAFIKRIGIESAPNGRVYRQVKDQLARLVASKIYIGNRNEDGGTHTQKRDIVSDINIFLNHEKGKKTIWPKTIRLSDEYFEALSSHAVPLDERALYLLKDSALELDLYSMLSERLHRIKDDGKGQFIPWKDLYQQYGGGYTKINKFRQNFLMHLKNVYAVYPSAKIEHEKTDKGMPKGLRLLHSPPPIQKKNIVSITNASNNNN